MLKELNNHFSINQQAVSINKTELKLLKSRRKPSGVATRAIIRSGIGHKYWSFLAIEKQVEIQMVAKEIHSLLFEPKLTNPISWKIYFYTNTILGFGFRKYCKFK